MSDNVKLDVKGKTLTITIDLAQEGEMSRSGKSKLIASTKGNVSVPGHADLHLGVNLYRK